MTFANFSRRFGTLLYRKSSLYKTLHISRLQIGMSNAVRTSLQKLGRAPLASKCLSKELPHPHVEHLQRPWHGHTLQIWPSSPATPHSKRRLARPSPARPRWSRFCTINSSSDTTSSTTSPYTRCPNAKFPNCPTTTSPTAERSTASTTKCYTYTSITRSTTESNLRTTYTNTA